MKEPIKRASEREARLTLPEERLLKMCAREYCQHRPVSLKDLMHRFEREIIYIALAQSNGSQRAAARMLGVRPSTLNYKVQNMGLVPVRRYLMIEDLPASAQNRLRRERRQDRAAGPEPVTAGTRR